MNIVDQARLLSSGTIASLIGETLYSRIDVEQARFVEFCAELESPCETWQEAWGLFWEWS